MTIGERIREVRKEKGLTQQALADRMGVTQSMIGQYERSNTPPKVDTLTRIARALRVPLADLFPSFEDAVAITDEAFFNPTIPRDAGPERETIQSIIATCKLLNEGGQDKVDEYAWDLLHIPDYQKPGVNEILHARDNALRKAMDSKESQ